MNEQRFQAYLEHRKMLAASRQSAFDAFDRAVLTLSSAMLALSMSFIRDIANGLMLQELLYCSWLSFFGAIVCTLMSFVESQRSMDLQEQIANDYYVREDDIQPRINQGTLG
jgi:hypothetical protein